MATDRQAGAAHGLAGVACALQAAGAYLDDPGLTLRAQGMRDRVAHLGPAGEVGWCRGAAGLAMCGLPDALWLEPLVRGAREHVAARHPDASLCHGLLGIADCMLTMARRRADLAHLRGLAEWVAEESARTLPCPGWPCGAGRETPGLLAGLAGIGLTYLRLADPTVPSPLEMSCPAAAPAITDTSARREPVEC
ncbi:MAG: lanthionine synthetase LanC family protein [Thermoleophilia bacterium]